MNPLRAQTETLRFPYYPFLSPDVTIIYFAYDGDIFRVGIDEDTAMRLVSSRCLAEEQVACFLLGYQWQQRGVHRTGERR